LYVERHVVDDVQVAIPLMANKSPTSLHDPWMAIVSSIVASCMSLASAFYQRDQRSIIYSALDLEFPGHRMMTIATTVLLTPDAYSTPADEERRWEK
jgi:hypothetical protein